jgi:hypothetical protein
MSSKLGPIEVTCDAPPYHIVQACFRIGLESAEDVRWCRMSNLPNTHGGWRQLIPFSSWGASAHSPQEGSCSCGQALPRLEAYTFTLITGKEVSYLLGQCQRCRAIYWDNV